MSSTEISRQVESRYEPTNKFADQPPKKVMISPDVKRYNIISVNEDDQAGEVPDWRPLTHLPTAAAGGGGAPIRSSLKQSCKDMFSRVGSFKEKTVKCNSFMMGMIMKNAFLYGIEFILNISFLVNLFIENHFVYFIIGTLFMFLSTIVSHYLALQSHLDIFTVQGRGGFLRKCLLYLKMNPFIQIARVYSANNRNQGLVNYLYYQLTLTHYTSHMVETFVIIILRLSYVHEERGVQFFLRITPIIVNILSITISTIDWETCKRSKNISSYDFMLILRWGYFILNIQHAVRFIIYTIMIIARTLCIFMLFYGLKWSNSELPFLIYAAHYILFFFNFGALCIQRERCSLANLLKTIFFSLSQTFYNSFDCYMNIPFKFHFILCYSINLASIITIVGLNMLFKSIKHTFDYVLSIIGYSIIGLYVLAGILAFIYKRFICPDVLRKFVYWKICRESFNGH